MAIRSAVLVHFQDGGHNRM